MFLNSSFSNFFLVSSDITPEGLRVSMKRIVPPPVIRGKREGAMRFKTKNFVDIKRPIVYCFTRTFYLKAGVCFMAVCLMAAQPFTERNQK